METLTQTLSYGTEARPNQLATIVSFGDGYEQRAPTGLNSKRLSFTLVWTGIRTAKAAVVAAFFEARGTTEAFVWTPPPPYHGAALQWIRRGPVRHIWNAYDDESIEVQIDQDFNPLP